MHANVMIKQLWTPCSNTTDHVKYKNSATIGYTFMRWKDTLPIRMKFLRIKLLKATVAPPEETEHSFVITGNASCFMFQTDKIIKTPQEQKQAAIPVRIIGFKLV